jgi:phosphoglycolate phosphatase
LALRSRRRFEALLGTTDDAVVRSAIDAYRDRFTSTGILENRVYPEVPAALAELTERGFMLYLLTSKPHVFATRIVDHFRLSAYFARIYGPELGDLDGTKISLLRRALMREKLELRTAVVVGDRREDVVAARENGVRSVGVTWGYGSREELEGAGAEEIVDSVSDLVSTLGAV